ncbi:single-stranded DNA-binding protein [Salinibacterium hongtaonis]|uniref:single-stranded DNA-binding protein n=1 Tax=Homoserinimonas hongtaonis TaxID=2079791 RepID=UPI000D334602|nr:single-stranded DNA-binding protein [Salinibacterium hongtaonis]AWB89534.1 single-stranded DNA-binding protein [Salinibacterium hongtaonis]
MTDTISLSGLVATHPKVVTTAEGLSITSFRLASTQRRYDRAKQTWVDGDTNWYTVTAFRRLASNAAQSLATGQRVLVAGRIRLREWSSEDRKGLTVEIEADSLGHDLTWGVAQFSRNSVVVSVPADVEANAALVAGDAAVGSSSDAEASELAPEPNGTASGWATPGQESSDRADADALPF